MVARDRANLAHASIFLRSLVFAKRGFHLREIGGEGAFFLE